MEALRAAALEDRCDAVLALGGSDELIPQLDAPRDSKRIDSTRAFFLIASGLFMKVVIASYLGTDASAISRSGSYTGT